MDLSVVIPAYNEETRLPATLARIIGYLNHRDLVWEVLVVDDGSLDSTVSVARSVVDPRISVISLSRNRGKGAAVRKGVLRAKGKQILITDADLSTPIDELERLEPLASSNGLVIGSRAITGSDVAVPQPRLRQLMGSVFRIVVSLAGVKGIRDSQCGFKLLSGSLARELFTILATEGFSWDVELLWLAQRNGIPIQEVGVRWLDAPGSKVRPFVHSLEMLSEILRFRWDHRGDGGGRLQPLPDLPEH